MAKRAKSSDATASAGLGETARAIVSILLFIHLFVLFVCLSANLAPSMLEQRLLRIFRPYAQLLNFDLDGTRYFLTHATIRDVDHRIEVLPKGEKDSDDQAWQNISRGVRGTERYHRYQRLADMLSYYQEDERTTALLAEAVARSYMLQEDTYVAEVRCRRHTLKSWENPDGEAVPPSDPDKPSYFSVVYRANVLTTPSGAIRILKRADASLEAAPDQRADGSVRAANPRSVGSAGGRGAQGVNSSQEPP